MPQTVIHVADDGRSAKVRSRMMQQLSFGGRPSLGAAIYENEAVKENGVWKFSKVHAFNTWTASYDGGWARNPGRRVPGPSETYPPDAPPSFRFEMFPTVYDIPFHYSNPVSMRTSDDVDAASGAARSRRTGMPEEIARALREIGPVIAPAETAALYAPLHADAALDRVTITRDARYGEHERHVLDVFTASPAGSRRPVLVFVHGGGFTRGAKSTAGSPFYDNVMLWAASEGLVGVNVNYRLAPEHQWPSGIEDLAAIVAWIERNIADHGGDPRRLFLWGHSAGAAHVADYLANAERSGTDAKVAGAILTSGFYDLGDEVSTWQAYYGADVSKYAERSSLPWLAATDVPLFVNDAELDPESFRIETRKLLRLRDEKRKPTRYVHLANHSHISETYAVGTADRSLSAPVLDFIRDHF